MTKICRRLRDRAEDLVRAWSLPRQLAGEGPYAKAGESTVLRDLRARLAADK